MGILDFNFDEFLAWVGEDIDTLMMLIWILPVIIFVFYGQRIQLIISSNEIKKDIGKLEEYTISTKKDFLNYIKNNLTPKTDPSKKLDSFFDYFTIMPVDMDPNGIISKINHLVRSREDFIRLQINGMFSNLSSVELSKLQNLLEIVTTLQLFHKHTRHLYLTAKKQKNFPLILPLQMMIPFIMEESVALKDAMPAIKSGQPIGDSVGPMVVGQMMLNTTKESAAFETVWSKITFEDRELFLLKAEGPNATVGRPGDGFEKIISTKKPDLVIMIDASLKLEGEDSASIAKGFGAAIGGIGTERFKIEEIATKNGIPILALVVKQSIHEAITLMTQEIADKVNDVRDELYEMIRENTASGQTILVIGVGNTIGVSQ
ncbi:DUF1512 domain-containing protein [Candidatus Nitrosopelagicus sp.]|nr:DUF1512 domain-containing protein [Candidatus Nitrosopelagicus sp.]